MSNDNTNDSRALPQPGAEQSGEFNAQACLFLRLREGRIECLVQYEGDVFVANPVDPEGPGVPDMSNPAVHFARWVENHLPALAQLSLGEFHLHQRMVSMVVVKDLAKPKLNLLAPDGSKLSH